MIIKHISLIYLIIVFFTVPKSFSQYKLVNQKEKEKIENYKYLKNNNIKSISVYSFDIENDIILPDSSEFQNTLIQGNKLTVKDFTPAYSKYEILFDDNYKILKTVSFSGDSSISGHILFEYGNNGELINKKYYFGGMLTLIEEYYFSSGILTKTIIRDSSEKLLETAIYRFNSQGFLVEESKYDSNDKMIQNYGYKYNSDGLCISEELFDPNGKLLSRYEYKYSDRGKLSESLLVNSLNQVISKLEYKYRNSELVSVTNYNEKGLSIEKHLYLYDSFGKISQERISDENGEYLLKYFYEYN